MILNIDSEFKNLIPPLTPEEYRQLEENLIKDGCIDPLIVWDGTIIDGHNRYEICAKHKIHYETKEHQFSTRDEAKEWIIRNQFGRRNITPFQRAELALQLKPILQAKAKENQRLSDGRGQKGLPNSVNLNQETHNKKINTQKELAKIAGVAHNTIYEVEQIHKNAPEEIIQKVRSGEMSISKAYQTTRPPKDKSVSDKSNEKEDKLTTSKPNEPVPEEKEVEKENSGLQEPEQEPESIFNIAYFQSVINGFLGEINPLSYSQILIQQMGEKDKKEYLNQIQSIRKWLNTIEENIKSNMEGY